MELSIGQKVSYPSQGVCLVERSRKKIDRRDFDKVLRRSGS